MILTACLTVVEADENEHHATDDETEADKVEFGRMVAKASALVWVQVQEEEQKGKCDPSRWSETVALSAYFLVCAQATYRLMKKHLHKNENKIAGQGADRDVKHAPSPRYMVSEDLQALVALVARKYDR